MIKLEVKENKKDNKKEAKVYLTTEELDDLEKRNKIHTDILNKNKKKSTIMGILSFIMKEKPSIIRCKILHPLKETVTKKVKIGQIFFEYDNRKYFIDLSCLTIDKGDYVIYYKHGYSQPIKATPTPDEIIFSKELTHALKGEAIKEFRISESAEFIKKMNEKIIFNMIGTGILAILIFWLVKNVMVIGADIIEMKVIVSTLKDTLTIIG